MSFTTLPQVLSNISGALGLPLAGEDHISGLLIYDDPTDYPSGILKKWVTATAFLEGDILEDDSDQKLYTVQGDYTSGASVAADVGTADLVEITSASGKRNARIKQIYKSNMEAYGIIEGGIADDIWYMLDKYFKKNPNGYIWCGFYSTSLGTVTFAEAYDFQLRTAGKIRKLGIYNNGNDAVFAAAHLSTLQTIFTTERTNKTPLSIVYCPLNYNETYDSFLDLRASGNNDGVRLFNSFDQVANSDAKPALGTLLGFYSVAKISESIGHVEQYNFVEGSDCENTYILDSSGLVKYEDISVAELNTLVTKAWNFLYKLTNYAGTYINGSLLAVGSSYSFQRAEQVDTMNKASRNIRTFCLPLLNSEVVFNSDGTLSPDSIAKYQNAAERALDPMKAAKEISDYAIQINNAQDVQSTNNLNILAEVILNGVSYTITVNLTAVAQLSS